MSIFHIINIKKKKIMDTGGLDFFNRKLILDYYFCLKSGPESGPVFLFQFYIPWVGGGGFLYQFLKKQTSWNFNKK
jgi:hypothetical protein